MRKKAFFTHYYIYGVIALWAVACFVFFQTRMPCHFFFKEQNQLFLFSSDYLLGYFGRPAWLACLVGDFLTQFYYYIFAGAAILTAALLTLGDLLRRSLQRAGVGRQWAFWVAIVGMTAEGAHHFYIGYELSSTVGLIGGAATYFVLSFLLRRKCWLSLAAVLAGAVACYWLFGIGWWVLMLLLLVDGICHWRQRQARWERLAWLVPLAVGGLVALTAERWLGLKPAAAVNYPGTAGWRMPNFLIEADLAVDNDYHFGNYSRVVSRVEQAQRRTHEMLFFYNLVKAQLGQLPNALLRFSPNELGTFYKIGPKTPLVTIRNMNELYWVVGDMTFTERAAMMTNVFSKHNRNVRMVQRLAECNVVSGDSLAAEKYLRLLDKTLVYRRWAQRVRDKGAEIYREKRLFCNHNDTISTTDNMHFMLMQLLDHNKENRVALDYLLCSDLLLKDIANFKRDYDRYCMGGQVRPAARLYQEALCIWLAGTQASEEEWQRYVGNGEVVRRFVEYNNQRGSSRFAGTYWYYYDRQEAPKVDL